MNRKTLSWCLFDFANSSYSAVISAVLFPVYYTSVIVGNGAGQGDVWWGRAISVSMAVVAVSSPFLGGIADYARLRKKLLFAYTLLCIVAVAALLFLRPGMVKEGFLLIVLANIGLEGGLVFYNAFLPEIAAPAFRGRVSAWGYGIGYAGSILSLLAALFLVKAGSLSLVWPMVALFFAFFSLPAFLFLPADQGRGEKIIPASLNGLLQTVRLLKQIGADRERRRFLLAYFLYEDGVNTVVVFSSIFAATTLHFSPEGLVLLYLVVQCTALAGAFLMARLIDFRGPRKVLVLSLLLWIAVAAAAFFVEGKTQFMFVASVAGLGLGTVQASSRAFYAQYIPEGREAEYFGVYSLAGKSSAVLGPLVFGYCSSSFGS
ncbi:MAG: MFS transporter, partial [Nitrospirales bacterium]|nr:MFS transporter [Nitrospirales bacterium]